MGDGGRFGLRAGRWGMWLALGAVLVALIVPLSWRAFGPAQTRPAIVVSRETTYLTGPLGPDGLPDYIGYWRAQQLGDHAPSDNALLPLLEAIGPDALIREGQQDTLGETVDLASLDVLERPFVDFEAHLLGGVCKGRGETCMQRYDEAMHDGCTGAPWRQNAREVVGRWLDVNAAALDRLHEALSRPVLYIPRDGLGMQPLETLPRLHLQKAHLCRARFAAERGDVDAAVDILADNWRRAGLSHAHHGLLSVMLAHIAWKATCRPLAALLSRGAIDGPRARRMLAVIERTPPPPDPHATLRCVTTKLRHRA